MPFNFEQLQEINQLKSHLAARISVPSEILIDFQNALGQGNLVPVTEDGLNTRLTERQIALINSLGNFSEAAMAEIIREGAVSYEQETFLCVEFVRAWIAAQGPIDIIFENLSTPLGLAVYNNLYDIVVLLTEAGANLEQATFKWDMFIGAIILNYSSLTLAIQNNSEDIAEHLICMGANVNLGIRALAIQRGARMAALIAEVDACSELTDRLVRMKLTRHGIEDDAVIDLRQTNGTTIQTLETEIQEHFCLLFQNRRNLLFYRRMVTSSVFDMLMQALAYAPREQIGDIVHNYHVQFIPVSTTNQNEQVMRSPSPAVRIPLITTTRALLFQEAQHSLGSVVPVAPSQEVTTLMPSRAVSSVRSL